MAQHFSADGERPRRLQFALPPHVFSAAGSVDWRRSVDTRHERNTNRTLDSRRRSD